MQTHDIDWFFTAGDIIIHAASNQGLLPNEINDVDNRVFFEWAITLDAIFTEKEVNINKKYVGQRLSSGDILSTKHSYTLTFMMMARRGFYSFDRDLDAPNHYTWVARPRKHIKAESLFQKSDLFRTLPFVTTSIGSFDHFSIEDGKIIIE